MLKYGSLHKAQNHFIWRSCFNHSSDTDVSYASKIPASLSASKRLKQSACIGYCVMNGEMKKGGRKSITMGKVKNISSIFKEDSANICHQICYTVNFKTFSFLNVVAFVVVLTLKLWITCCCKSYKSFQQKSSGLF